MYVRLLCAIFELAVKMRPVKFDSSRLAERPLVIFPGRIVLLCIRDRYLSASQTLLLGEVCSFWPFAHFVDETGGEGLMPRKVTTYWRSSFLVVCSASHIFRYFSPSITTGA